MSSTHGAAYQAFVICTSPRSGSTLLCKLLAATGKAGNPKSYFHDNSLDEWQDYLGLGGQSYASGRERLTAFLEAARDQGRAGTSLFGLRLQGKSFAYFTGQLKTLFPDRATHAARIEAAFGKTLFIHLTRKDKVAQAVSFVKASQSGLWHKAPDGSELERLSPPRELAYDPDLIRQHLDEMTRYDEAWNRWFQEEGLQPLRISYDALSSDPEQVLTTIFDRLGLDPDGARGIELPVAKLSDEVNRDWIDRFRADQCDR